MNIETAQVVDETAKREEKKVLNFEDVFAVTDTKQKQKIIDLNNPTATDTTIEVVQRKLTVKDGVSLEDAIETALGSITPAEKKLTALVNFLQSEAYQESKKQALSKGEYMTPQLRSQLVQIMGNLSMFADMSAADIYKKWLEGFTSKEERKQIAARKLLDRAKAALSEDESEFADLA